MNFPRTGPRADEIEFAIRLADGTDALVRELTAAGMHLQTRAPIQIGTAVVLELRPPHSGLLFTAEGVVVGLTDLPALPGGRVRFTRLRFSGS